MSTFGAEQNDVSDSQRARQREEFWKKLNPSNKSFLSLYMDRTKGWTMVPNGSLMGHFDWVPLYLRIGPWSPFASFYLILVGGVLWNKFPGITALTNNLNAKQQVQQNALFTMEWFYNLMAFIWMSYILHRLLSAGSKFILCTYTIQSWCALILRHALAVLLPILSHSSSFTSLPQSFVVYTLGVLHRRLRFHALFSATTTFAVWNFLLFPYVYFIAMKTPTRRRNFVKWSFSFNLCQIHLCNIMFAFANTVFCSSSRKLVFDSTDLWVAACLAWFYSLFYLLVLDRFGVHLYPIFSPRSHLIAVSGATVWGMLYITFAGWNYVIRRS